LAYLSRIEEGEEYLNRALFFCEKNQNKRNETMDIKQFSLQHLYDKRRVKKGTKLLS
jgi:hypothetical protein